MRLLMSDVYHHLEQLSNVFLCISRRELWKGLAFNEDLRVGEDDVLMPQLLARASSCWHIGKPLYRYCICPGSLSTDWNEEKDADLIRIKELRIENAPQEFKRAAVWGAAVGFYWGARGEGKSSNCRIVESSNCGRGTSRPTLLTDSLDLPHFGRKWIRHHFHVLVAEALFGHGMSLRIRLGWMIRFACAAMDFWLLHRLRDRHRAGGRGAQ